MDIFGVLTLIGGIAFFLFGMNIMSSGLEKLAGNKLEGYLKKLTANRFSALGVGAGITAVIQSSSAVTVMLVGLVNSGIMSLGQSIGVIMGSNIGTTMTAWILSLTGIESTNIALQLCKPENFSPILALIGVVLTMVSKSPKKKNIGEILLGFALLMFAMEVMSGAVEPLAESPEFASILTAFSVPIIGVVIGAALTGIIQSSSATTGILQSFALTGSVTFGMAIPIIMGINIGTCVTAAIASIGVNKNAKRVAVVHLCFNLIGTGMFMALFYGLDAVFDFPLKYMTADPVGIALVHTVFNVGTTCVLIGFTKQLEKLAHIIVKDKADEKEAIAFLDERLMKTPGVAVTETKNVTVRMAGIAQESVAAIVALLGKYDKKAAETVRENEARLDRYEDRIGSYLVKVSSLELSEKDGQEVTKLLHTIGDFESIGDKTANIERTLEKLHDKEEEFTKGTRSELAVLASALNEIVELTVEVFKNDDIELAAKIEPLEQVIDDVARRIKKRHVARLKAGDCTVERGIALTDTLTNIRRISDYCSNVAVCVIQIAHSTFETHNYLQKVKYTNQPEFISDFEYYKEKYKLD